MVRDIILILQPLIHILGMLNRTVVSLSRKYLIVWSDRSGNPKLLGQLLDTDGERVDNPFLIESGPSSGARVTYDSVERRFLVVWSSDSPGDYRIYGQLVDPHGALIGDASPISSLTGRVQIDPSVAFDPPNHQFLVIWRERHDEVGPSASSLHGQRVNSDGSLQGIELILSSEINSHLFSVAVDHQAGKFLVLWNEGIPSVPGHSSDIAGQFINSDGTFSGLPFLVSTDIGATGHGGPSVIFDAYQRLFLAVWESDPTVSSATIAGQVIYPSGQLWGSNLTMAQSGLQGGATPSLSFNAVADTVLLVWGDRTSEDEGDIWGASVTLPTDHSHLEDITIATNTTWESGIYSYHNVSITNNATLIFNGAVTLNATNLTIETGSAISADGRGYPSALGHGAGRGLNVCYHGGGGAYGGKGGEGAYSNTAGSTIYGSAIAPVELGSGGSGGGNNGSVMVHNGGGGGGGAIKLNISDTLNLNGAISSNGEHGKAGQCSPGGGGGYAGGGGSGGSMYITATNLTGNGVVAANGGPGVCSHSGLAACRESGGGGGGRIAIYYKNSSFTGRAEAKGAIGYRNGDDGTVFVNPLSFSDLSEKSYTQSNLIEAILVKKATLDSGIISGDLNGTLKFAYLDFVTAKKGSFADKGFSTGKWEAYLEGLPYKGNWQGVLYLKEAERRIYLKGTVSGEISGIVDGYLIESTPESNIYDKYQATWRFNRVGAKTTSGKIYLKGTVVYQTTTEYPSTQLYVLQSSIEGTAFGHYTGPLSTVLTHVRIADGTNPYNGEGFSILSLRNLGIYLPDC